MHAELAAQGLHVGRKRVARLMVAAGLAGRCRPRTRRTTYGDPEARAMNLLARCFGPEGLAIGTVWAGDITYVRTWEGWAHLATVIDLASRKVVGWAIAEHMESSLVCEAMRMALLARRPCPRLMFCSDQGSQYVSHEFRQLLEEHHITQSLSRPAQCWDNSVAEAWFGTYKLELVEERTWRSIAQLRAETLLWIEGWYNLRRRHSSLRYLSPVEYERRPTGDPTLPKRPDQTVRRTGATPAYRAVQEGAAGVDMGRNIFQSASPASMIQAVGKVVHEGLKPAETLELYHDLARSRGANEQ